MREFEYIFDQGLLGGIRRSKNSRKRGQALVEAYNVMQDNGALSPFEPLEIPDEWKSLERMDGFPRIFQGSNHSYLITKGQGAYSPIDQNYYVYDIADDFTLSSIRGFAAGEFPDFHSCADFGEFSIITSPWTMVMINRVLSSTLNFNPGFDIQFPYSSGKYYPYMATCCSFRGQLLGGNILNDWYGCGKNSVVFSDIGSANMTPDRRNEAGNIFLPVEFTIMSMLPLVNNVIVYTSGDVWALNPVSDPAPTYGKAFVASVGIMSTRAVAGSETGHVFVDYSGAVWRIDAALKLTKLGYQEIFAGQEDSIRVLYDKLDNSWRISCNNGDYLLREDSLTKIFQSATGIYCSDDYRVFIGEEATNRSAVIVTDSTDFGYRGIKTIHGIELGIDSSVNASVAVDYRFSAGKDFVRTIWTKINSLGQIARPQAGSDFRICVKFANYYDAHLDYIKVRYKMSDMRGIRGVYAPPPRGQYVS